MLRVVNQIIIQGYLKNADVVHVFFSKKLVPVSQKARRWSEGPLVRTPVSQKAY